VRWEWFYYAQVAANLYFMDFEKSGLRVTARTNIDFYQPNLRPNRLHPAVEML
jgi:hypothetical protein